MQISGINRFDCNYNNNYGKKISFTSKYNYDRVVRRRDLEKVKPKIQQSFEPVITTFSAWSEEYENKLKSFGISHLSGKNGTISIATRKNGGFYTMNTSKEVEGDKAKFFVLSSLMSGHSGLGGFLNYVQCLDDLKRQDIVQKGLRISSYDVNINVSKDTVKNATDVFSYALKERIYPDEIFFLENDAIYYDKFKKEAHSIHNCKKLASVKTREVFFCKFLTDEKGNAIGYKMKHVDPYSSLMRETTYVEQQTPSEVLPDIVYDDNNKFVAEAFRFGNSKPKDIKEEQALSDAIKDVQKKLKDDSIPEEDVKLARISDENGNITVRLNYFNPSSGLSLSYNEKGQYLHQMEYVKNAEGSIIAVTKY